MKRSADINSSMISVEYLQNVFEFSPVPSVIFLPDEPVFHIVYVNSAFERINHKDKSLLIGESILTILPEQATLLKKNIYPIKNHDGEVQYLVYCPNTSPEYLSIADENDKVRQRDDQHSSSYCEKEETWNVKKQYQQLFNAIHISAFIFDLETLLFLDVNTTALAAYGYSRDEFLSMTIMDIIPEEDIPLVEDTLKNKLKSGLFDRRTSRHIKKNGDLLTVITEGNAIKFNGRKARIVTATDITAKIKAERILNDGESLFRSLIQEGSDLIGVVDSRGKYLYVSPTYEKLFNLKNEEIIQRNAFDFVHEDDFDQVSAAFNLLSGQKRIKLSPYRFYVSPDEFRWMDSIITDMRDDPNVMGILVNSVDVTQIMTREMELAKSIERFNIVSKATSDAVYDYNILADELKWNQGINGIFGFKNLQNLRINWWYQHVHPDDLLRVKENFNLMIATNQPSVASEYRFQCADGNYKYVLDRSFLVYDNVNQPIRMIGSLQDITEKVSYIQDIEEQNCRLKDISWMQSHVVRAPLARLMGLAELISCENINEELLTPFKESARELDQIIRNIVKKAENL